MWGGGRKSEAFRHETRKRNIFFLNDRSVDIFGIFKPHKCIVSRTQLSWIRVWGDEIRATVIPHACIGKIRYTIENDNSIRDRQYRLGR